MMMRLRQMADVPEQQDLAISVDDMRTQLRRMIDELDPDGESADSASSDRDAVAAELAQSVDSMLERVRRMVDGREQQELAQSLDTMLERLRRMVDDPSSAPPSGVNRFRYTAGSGEDWKRQAPPDLPYPMEEPRHTRSDERWQPAMPPAPPPAPSKAPPVAERLRHPGNDEDRGPPAPPPAPAKAQSTAEERDGDALAAIRRRLAQRMAEEAEAAGRSVHPQPAAEPKPAAPVGRAQPANESLLPTSPESEPEPDPNSAVQPARSSFEDRMARIKGAAVQKAPPAPPKPVAPTRTPFKR